MHVIKLKLNCECSSIEVTLTILVVPCFHCWGSLILFVVCLILLVHYLFCLFVCLCDCCLFVSFVVRVELTSFPGNPVAPGNPVSPGGPVGP